MEPRRILIIDDNPDIHRDYAAILASKPDRSDFEALEYELFGHKPASDGWTGPRFDLDFASQGEEGVGKIKSALAKQAPFQLAFVDMRMPPGWDGLKTIQEIWKHDQRIQIVLCTAYSDYSWEDINQALGTTDNLLILKKPFDSSEVAQLASTLTQKWRLAREAQASRDELERLVARRTKALNQSNTLLKQEMAERKALEEQLVRSQKMQAIGTLAAGVAHDLNNVLSGILSYPELLLLKLTPDDPMYRPLTIIRQSAQKAAAMVQDLLTMAQRHVVVAEPVDLAQVVSDFLDSPACRTICEYHPKVRITPRIESDTAMVLASAVHLEKVVMNLVSNAAEAMPEGGQLLIGLQPAVLEAPPPEFPNVSPGEYLKLTVTDEGLGISDEDLKHIFEPFFTKKKLGRSGTGLGMTVVWDTILMHKGYVDVNTREARGTTVTAYLPVADRPKEKTPPPSPPADLRGRGKHILVVDDIASQREIACAILNELGYRAEAVSSGEAALAFMEREPVDLLILDMIMDPGMDGLETLQRARALRPEQKAIIASGYTQNDRVQEALALGAAFVPKPYRLEVIGSAVQKALEDAPLS
jgi:signal transduction histidine kinase